MFPQGKRDLPGLFPIYLTGIKGTGECPDAKVNGLCGQIGDAVEFQFAVLFGFSQGKQARKGL